MDTLIAYFNTHWLIFALAAPALWALVNIIDVYFVDGIYKDEWDGIIISALFQILPWPLLFIVADFSPFMVLHEAPVRSAWFFDPAFLLSFGGGLLFTLSSFFYFKALFDQNDAPMLQVMWNAGGIMVPLLSFVFLSEVLPVYKYIGILIALLGTSILSLHSRIREKFSWRYLWISFCGILFLSMSMVMEGRAYDLFGGTIGGNAYWAGFFFFSLGVFIGGLFFALFSRRNSWALVKKYYKIFLLAEGLSFVGIMASQRALDISPSASYVVTVETLLPLFVVAWCLVFGLFSLHKKFPHLKQMYTEQVEGIFVKVIATVIVVVGVYIIS